MWLQHEHQPGDDPVACIYVPGHPVSVNQLYGTRARGYRYLRPEARDWREDVYYACRRWLLARGLKDGSDFGTPLDIRCAFVGVRGDADNYLKLTLDGLKDGLGVDDRHFSPVSASVLRPPKRLRADTSPRSTGCLIHVYRTTAARPVALDMPPAAPVSAVQLLQMHAYDSYLLLVPAHNDLVPPTAETGVMMTYEELFALHAQLTEILTGRRAS